MKRGFLAFIGIVVTLFFLLLSFVGPWYHAGYTVYNYELSVDYYLTKKETSFLSLSYQMEDSDLKATSFWEGYLVDVCHTTLYLLLIGVIFAALAFIGIAGIAFSFGNQRTMKRTGSICSLLALFFIFMAVISFLIMWDSQIIVEGSSIGSQQYGFWYGLAGWIPWFSMGPGFSWYLTLIAGVFAMFSFFFIGRKPEEDIHILGRAVDVSPEMKKFVGTWETENAGENARIEFLADGLFRGFGEKDTVLSDATWEVQNDKIVIYLKQTKGTSFGSLLSPDGNTLILTKMMTGEKLLFKRQNSLSSEPTPSVVQVPLVSKASLSPRKPSKKPLVFTIIIGLLIILPSVSSLGVTVYEDMRSDEMTVVSQPFLWRIEGAHPSYLYGSYHVSDERVLTLPDVVIEAIDDADVVYTEVTLSEVTDDEVLQFAYLPNNQTLHDVLPRNVYTRLSSFFTSKGFALKTFERFKVWEIVFMLPDIEDKESSLKNIPVKPMLDSYVENLAMKKGKTIAGLETLEEQCTILDRLTGDEQAQLLDKTLDLYETDLTHGYTLTEMLETAYLEGNLTALRDSLYYDYNESNLIDAKIWDLLITERNHRMTERIIDQITKNPETQFFFTVGAGHYFGEEGIIQLLQNQGYTVTRVTFEKCSQCDSSTVLIRNRCYYPYEYMQQPTATSENTENLP